VPKATRRVGGRLGGPIIRKKPWPRLGGKLSQGGGKRFPRKGDPVSVLDLKRI